MADEQKVSILYEIKQIGQAVLGDLSRNLNDAAARADEFKKKMEGLGKVGQTLAIGAGAVTAALGFLGKAALSAAGEVEQQRVAFKGLLGSYEAADKVIARIRKEAAATPFDTAGLTRMTQQLATITKDGGKAVNILMNVGDAIATSGKDIVEMERVVLNLQQVAATGKVTELDIKQFQSAIPIFNDILKSAGLTTEELKNSKDSANLLFGAFEKAAKQGGIAYGGLANQSKTLAGITSTLQDNFAGLIRQLGEGLLPIVKPIVTFLNDLMGRFQNLAPEVKTFIAVFGGVVFIFAAITAALGAFLAILPAIAAGFALLGLSMSAAFFGIPILIAALVAGFMALRGHADEIAVALKNAFDTGRIAFNNFLIAFLSGIAKIADVLNKIPGVNIDVEGTISKLEEMNAALEEKKAERLASLEDEENQKTEIETTKLIERKALIAEIELADAENKSEMQQIMDEAKAVKEEEEGNAFREKLYARSAEELASIGYTQDQINAIKTSKDKQQKDALKKGSTEYANYLAKAGEEEQNIGKAVAQGTLNYAKDSLKQQILAKSAELMATGSAMLIATLGASPQGWAHLAGGATLAVAGTQAVDKIQLAEGGSMIVDTPTAIGPNVIAGEAGPERIDVTPMGEAGNGTIINNIILDGEVIATHVAKVNQGQRTDGTLDDGL